MGLNQLVFRSMQKNIRQYFLYFFALIFSVTLFFSFVTLQYNDDVLKATEASGTATTGFEVATYLLYFIVLFFVLYANHLMLKRRSKEVGLYQLIGMTKGKVMRLLAYENSLLFVGALIIGMVLGLLSSRLFAMILLKILHIDTVVAFSFSSEAIRQTLLVFGAILLIILVQLIFVIQKSTLLSLFQSNRTADVKVKSISWLQVILGIFGIACIIYGYYESTRLFDKNLDNLFRNMLIILATTISGVYFFFRFSIASICNLLRKRKKGHLSLVDVLALTPIMHRMKSNAKSLTLITVLTAFALAITTLSYISYYSADQTAKIDVPADYIVLNGLENEFLAALKSEKITYATLETNYSSVQVNFASFLTKKERKNFGSSEATFMTIPFSDYKKFNKKATLQANEMIVTGEAKNDITPIVFTKGDRVEMKNQNMTFTLTVQNVYEKAPLISDLRNMKSVLVVPNELFKEIQKKNIDKEVYYNGGQKAVSLVNPTNAQRETAEKLYVETGANAFDPETPTTALNEYNTFQSHEAYLNEMYHALGILIFTTAFLGLAFLLATGSILYFKQMSEADDESASYMILRKIGFTKSEILKGVCMKQLFNYGVPLGIGLVHSYFAVKSGWFLFGTELVTPMIIMMSLYSVLYILFALLSIAYYRKVIERIL